MASTYLSLHFHIIFSTKQRRPYIADGWRTELHEYLGGTIRGLGGFPEGVGGIADHVHLLMGLKATHCLSDIMRELKKASSTWIHREKGFEQFAWQEGYAAFTVSPTSRSSVRAYIAHQESHHQQKSFREELLELLKRAQVEFDERYLE